MARYYVQSMDSSAEGMERLRMQSEFILLAYASGDSSPADIAEQWADDLAQSEPLGEGFDFDAAGQAVAEWAASNGDLIARELGTFRDMAERGELNWNDESAAEFDSAPLRLYVSDAWHGEPSAYRFARLIPFKCGAVALVLLDSPHRAWACEEAKAMALAAYQGEAGEPWDSCAYPVGDKEREAKPGVQWLVPYRESGK